MEEAVREAVKAALRRLAVIPFFPTDEDDKAEIIRTVEDMIGDEVLFGSTPQQRIDWLVKATIDAMREWKSIPELRGILCWRWKPADGKEGFSTLPGYSPEDSESCAISEYASHKVEAGRAEPKLLAEGEEKMPAAELAELHRDTVGTLAETTKWPWLKEGKTLAEAERELAEAPKRHLSEAEKARRLAELEASLKKPEEV